MTDVAAQAPGEADVRLERLSQRLTYYPGMRQPGGGRRSAAMLGLYALVLLGVVATVLAVRDERSAADQLDMRAADDAVTKVRAALEEAVGAVRGVDAIAISGRVDPAAFRAFAAGVVDDSPFPALAYAQVVSLDQRQEFEQTQGVTIRDTDGEGGLRPGEPRDRSIVVVDAYPRNETTKSVIGFDIASDPVRARAAAAASATDSAVLSDRISTVSNARPGVSLVVAVRDPAGRPVGFVTSGLAIDALVRDAGVDADALAGFELSMDGDVLIGSPTGGASRTFDVAGRQFRLTADDEGGVGMVMPLIIGFGTVALAFAVARAAARDRRQRSRLTRLSRRNRNIAELGQRLAGSLGPSAVLEELALSARTILDAQWSLVVQRTPDAPDGVPVDPLDQSLVDAGPMLASIDVVRSSIERAELVAGDNPMLDGAPLVVPDGPRTLPVVETLSAPLVFSSGLCVGAVAFGWTQPLTPEQAEDRSLAATTIAELASRAMERAVISDVVQERAQGLSVLARSLASAHTSDDVAQAVAAGVAPLLGANSAQLVQGEDAATDGSRELDHPVKDANGRSIGGLRIDWDESRPMNPTEAAVLATVSDLIGQTLERTALSDQEHEVIVQFQQALLSQLPPIEGVEIASAYSPAMSVVGLGGDFFDVVAIDPCRTCIVVGDITGHGPEAVAAMAELTSVIHHLLSSRTTLEATVEQADLLLARRGVLATLQIVELDTEHDVLRYVNAGHPYPVVRTAGGPSSLLTDGRRPMLGLGTSSDTSTATQAPFHSGDLLLLYTDGLIERRTADIDQCMADLLTTVDAIGDTSLPDFVDQVQLVNSTSEGRVDDDVALIAVRRR